MIRRHLTGALAATLALFGCCAPPPHIPAPPESRPSVEVKPMRPKVRTYTFHVDDVLSPFAFTIVQRAFAVWERYSNGLVRFDVRHDLTDANVNEIALREPAIVIVHSSHQVVTDYEQGVPCDGCTMALTLLHSTHPTIMLVMDRLQDPRDFYETLIHEIGHAIGIPHIPDEESVMYPNRGVLPSTCPTRPDMLAFCRAADCELRDVRWCD